VAATPEPQPIDRQARRILRRIRDLNLAARLDVGGGRRVSIEGCSTLDSPVERGVRYRISSGEKRGALSLVQEGDGLEISLSGLRGEPRLELELVIDGEGRAASPTIAARLNAEETDPLAVEHFLRRVVRALFVA